MKRFNFLLTITLIITSFAHSQKNEWQTSEPEDVGINSQKINRMVSSIQDSTYKGIHSVVIIKDGKLVFEKYFPGYQFNYMGKRFRGKLTNFNIKTIHNLASVTKSVTALLFGIAMDQGFIKSVNEKAVNYFPKYSFESFEKWKEITLHHLLTMTSGFKWNEHDIFYSELENDIIQIFVVPDPLKYIFSKPVVHKPGNKWYYNGGGTNLIGEIIQETSGLRLDKFAEKYLFNPLGITQYKWIYIKPDIVYATGDLKLTPRALAKLGYLVLNDGTWNGQRIISSEWLKKMIQEHWSFSETEGYGYQWWLRTHQLGSKQIDSYYASGWGGQNILVFPSLNTVVVFTAGNYDTQNLSNEILYRYILPAIEPNFDYDFARIRNQAPISGEFNIVKPVKELNSNIAAISGHWYGRWEYWLASQLVIEKIDSTEAEIIYAWGTHRDGYFQNGWKRYKAKVYPAGKVEFTDEATWRFEIDQSGDELIGYYNKDDIHDRIIMKRKEMFLK